MHSKFYIYASGNEKDIRALHDSLKLQGSGIRAFFADPPGQGKQWMWYSPYQECSSDFPEDELAAFLHGNSGLLQQLKTHRAVLHELAGIIVCQFDEDEQPRGYSISPDLMRLLANANASLEIDIEQLVPGDPGEGKNRVGS